jgi:hypothetical protein
MHRASPVLFLVFATACIKEPVATYSGAHDKAAKKQPVVKAAPSTTTLKRNVVSFGRTVGSDVITRAPDGTITIALDVLENGRGPHVDATTRLSPDGTITSFDARGHHTMGTTVEEAFLREAKHAKWKSKEESGEKDLAGPSFYVPMAECPDALGLLAEALVKAKAPIALLPAGEAKIEKATEITVKAGSEQRHLVGWAITGLELTPTRVWMNDDGTFWGYTSEWFSVVPEGWESAIDTLVQKQNGLERERDAKNAKALSRRPPNAGIAYVHARVLDVERGRYMQDATVWVVGDVIRKVGPTAVVKPDPGAEIVDLSGKTILPGLWDMHAHLSDADGALNLASGVTTVRDVGNDPDKLDDYKKRYDDGSAIGPHVLRMGFIEGRNEKAASSKITAETEDEAKKAVAFYAKRGYEGIKIYNSVKPELVPLLASEAHAKGMMVTGHIPVHMLANEAVTAGYDGIEHINMLFLNFFADHETDTRTTTRFTLVGEKAAGFDLKSKPALEFYAQLRSKKTIVDPTVGVFEGLLVDQPGRITPGLESLVNRLPVQTQRGFLVGGVPFEGKEDLYKQSFDKVLAMVKVLADQKVTVVAGTDAIAGLWLHHELALFVRAGLTPAQALKMATIEPARAMKQDFRTGSIAENKTADLIVVDGDPLLNIADLAKVASTMRSGVIFAAGPLYESVGVKPYTPR